MQWMGECGAVGLTSTSSLVMPDIDLNTTTPDECCCKLLCCQLLTDLRQGQLTKVLLVEAVKDMDDAFTLMEVLQEHQLPLLQVKSRLHQLRRLLDVCPTDKCDLTVS